MLEEKRESSFVCINHAASSGGGGGTHNYAAPDLQPIVLAIGRLAEKLENLRLNVWVPDPQVIEVAPIIHIPESPITIQQPAIHLPENRPVIEVKPSEVVIQRVDGQIVQTTSQPVKIEITWQVLLIFAIATAIWILDIVTRSFLPMTGKG